MEVQWTEEGSNALIASGDVDWVRQGSIYLGDIVVPPASGGNEEYTILFN